MGWLLVARYLYQECALSSGSRGLLQYSFSVEDDVWSLLWVQLGYLAGLQVILCFVMVFLDYSDESGSNAVDHAQSTSSPRSKPTSSSASVPVPAVEDSGTNNRSTNPADSKLQPLLAVAGNGDDDFRDDDDDAMPAAVPTALEFQNLSYSVKIPPSKACGKPTQRKLLTNITGFVVGTVPCVGVVLPSPLAALGRPLVCFVNCMLLRDGLYW